MTASIVPSARPELPLTAVRDMLALHGASLQAPALLGRRAYYRDTMGVPGANDWGIYDDAIFYCSPTAFASFNANTDPSRHHPGVAVLKAGVWRYRLGIHNQSKDPVKHPHYKALVQGEQVTVAREGQGDDTGWFGINIHRGGFTTTSSEGCQTIHPSQWDAFIGLVDGDMKRHGVLTLPYVLTER